MTSASIGPPEIARLLTERTDKLAAELLSSGHRERNRDWRCGSVAGDAGTSLIVALTGKHRGRWRDFATGEHGDLLDLIAANQQLDIAGAIVWAQRWLGIVPGETRTPSRPASAPTSTPTIVPARRPTWLKVWCKARRPIAGTLAERYLDNRGLVFADPGGAVLRFDPRRCRLKPGSDSEFEYHPAVLALLRDVLNGEPCGIVNVFLLGDGHDRIRDSKGKTSTGRAGAAAVMLGKLEGATGGLTICKFEDVTYGLTICEGPETAIAIDMSGQAPVWALGGAGNLAAFPVLPGVEALTIAADTGAAGQTAAREVAARWRNAGREVRTITPPDDDWADVARRTAQ